MRACGFATWHVVRSAIVCGREGAPACRFRPRQSRSRRGSRPSRHPSLLPPPATAHAPSGMAPLVPAHRRHRPPPGARHATARPRMAAPPPRPLYARRALALPQVAFQGQWWQLGGAVRPETRSLPPHPGPAALEPAPTRPCAPLISGCLAAHIISILPHAPHPRPPSVGREAAPAAPGHACPGAPRAPPPSDRRPPAPAPAPAPAGAGGEDLGPHRRRPRPVPDE